MIDCLIVDDEAPARQHVARLLEAHQDVRVIGEAVNGLDALQRVADDAPGVIFLDIEMPGLNGLDVVRQMPRQAVVVFVTAYDHYAVRAFDANAIDYVLKPVTPERLAQAVDKVRTILNRPRREYEAALRAAVDAANPKPPAKLAAQRGRRLVLVAPREVFYAVAEDKLVFICTASERLLVNRTIAELESLLASAGFVRTSRSTLVNFAHARELIPWSSGTWKLKLSNGVELGVSRERARAFKARIA